MGRPVILSNGHILVGLNEYALVHDFYFPYVGLENLTTARFPSHKIGVWIGGKFSWLDDGSWQINLNYEPNALVSDITAIHPTLKIKLHFTDFVDSHYPAFGRIITISNENAGSVEVRLFMYQAFQVSRSGRSDTSMFIPDGNYLLDYKGWSNILIYSQTGEGKVFDQFAVGNHDIEGKEGTFRDAEDGQLSGSLVEHGNVDSAMGLTYKLPAGGQAEAQYWVVANESQFDAEAIHHVFLKKGIRARLEATRQSWSDWLAPSMPKLDRIDAKYRPLAIKSLLMIKAHTDKHGGVIASSDSSIYNYGKDYYCYVWPRDGAYTMIPLIDLGLFEEPKKFFVFCADTIHPRGYMMHKYQPDRAVGSTWHPQLNYSHPELPIQEDETAIIVYAVNRFLEASNDEDFVRTLYNNLITPAANFMGRFIDERTNLPHATYDLWEERFGTHTYSVFVTQAGLRAAANIAKRFNKPDDANNWLAAAQRISNGLERLYIDDRFCKSLLLKADGTIEYDGTLDSANGYGPLTFGDPERIRDKLDSTYDAIEKILFKSCPAGGVPRYEHDNYFLDKKYLGNPWIITTLWLAQFYIKKNRINEAKELLDWACARAGPSGMLAEQVEPENGSPVGVNPLVWSHSTFLETALMLADANGAA